jgi:pyruvate dehydrogenase E2 component (dihydrolipoamide acetyltransferase)
LNHWIGTITISNLGMFGVSYFDAILPSGTGTILAISAALPRVVQLPSGHFGVQKYMTVTVTSDHRHIYGADAAKFLADLADILENNVQSLTMG